MSRSTNSSSAGFLVTDASRECSARWSFASPLASAVDERAQVEQVGLVEAIGGEARDELLEREARLEHLVEPGVHAVEVQDGSVDDRVRGRLDHHEAAARSPPHGGDLLVLDEANRLAEHRPAHAVLLQELGLGAEHLADRPVLGHDVGQDLRRDGGSKLRHRANGNPFCGINPSRDAVLTLRGSGGS